MRERPIRPARRPRRPRAPGLAAAPALAPALALALALAPALAPALGAACLGCKRALRDVAGRPAVLAVGEFRLVAGAGHALHADDGWAQRAAPIALRNALAGAPDLALAPGGATPTILIDGDVRRTEGLWAYDLRLAAPPDAGDVAPLRLTALGATLREAALGAVILVRKHLGLEDVAWPDAAATELAALGAVLERTESIAGPNKAAARTRADDWMVRFPERPHGFVLRARVERLAGDFGTALTAAQSALARDPGDARALLETARILLDAGRPADARAHVERVHAPAAAAGAGAAAADAIAAERRLLDAVAAARLGAGEALANLAGDPPEGLPPADRLALARSTYWRAVAAPTPEARAAVRCTPPPERCPNADLALADVFARHCARVVAGGPSTGEVPLDPGSLVDRLPALGAAHDAVALAVALEALDGPPLPVGDADTLLVHSLEDLDAAHVAEAGPWAAFVVAELRWRIGGAAREAARGWYARVLQPSPDAWRHAAEAALAAERLASLP